MDRKQTGITTKEQSLSARWRSSTLADGNAAYLEELYEQFLRDPASVPSAWRSYFESLPRVDGVERDVSHSEVREEFRRLAHQPRPAAAPREGSRAVPDESAHKQVKVLQLINAFRYRAHQTARLDPLGLREAPAIPELDPRYHGLSEADLDAVFETGSLVGPRRASLREILELLRATYSATIGAEYMHITDTAEKRWLQSCIESVHGLPAYPPETRRNLLERLTAAEGIEHYLHTRYVGQKRFSLEGAESLIPLLDESIQRAGANGTKEVIIGMAHRGRLNVLVNILGKSPAELFREFEGKAKSNGGTGDVKYHLGYSSDIATEGGAVHVALAFNPSHLEIVGPVVQGSVRARQERRRDSRGNRVLPVVIHGDAAFAGQGVVMETLSMSQSRGYSTKGTLHVVINNQIGFTTSHQQDARSTLYCTDIAKAVGAPIFHVNGDDPEAVLFIAQIALDYRMTFHKDVVIDLYCYRRHGHSEADEPTVTQPIMYQNIHELPTTRALYAKRLAHAGLVNEDAAASMLRDYQQRLESGADVAPHLLAREKSEYAYGADWNPYVSGLCDPGTEKRAMDGAPADLRTDTRVTLETVRALTERMLHVPEGLELHSQINKIYEARRKMAAGALPLDWGFAENLAYATLLKDGYAVRISGQDSGRGTFFHRHAVVHHQKDGSAYVPLRNLFEGQPNFLVINSLLSEEAVLAFEYGYATADPKTLTIWEAQFGDFANNAQVVIDQFICSGEQKWSRLCGLVLFLPHGFEGQGPEHSSARLERYLQLCAQQNMFVCVPTTPAQFFHLLRRQMLWSCRKPLVLMTPKSLLRHRASVSSLEDLTQGRFRPVLYETEALEDAAVKEVVLCSGKVYYDLAERRQARGRRDVAILRIEQLYPFPEEELRQAFQRYPAARRFIWCQEEPRNQGVWYQTQHRLWRTIPRGGTLEYAGRPTSAAPAVGNYQLHVAQLHDLLDQALGPVT
ncbi:MAG: 2-oxoglutarate dehydrogenase E1 component [Gammaproteobacteria bacterium]|nr:2-oxoglutarate dehydrogenase E1 component [Gammaproteobacteria bacterium]